MQSWIKSMGLMEWAMLIVVSVLRGGSFFFIEVAVKTIQPFTLLLARVSLGALILALVLLEAAVFPTQLALGRRIFRRLGISPIAVSAGQLGASVLLMLPMALMFEQPWDAPASPVEAISSTIAPAVFSLPSPSFSTSG
jgi:drug/metabolite transporter (DMT)-like permease